MSKVKCSICGNEVGGLCSIKKIGVKENKPRICKSYVYEETKVKAKQEIPTIRVGYAELQVAKKLRKEARKLEIEALKAGAVTGISPSQDPYRTGVDVKHPLTGDLSRFTTTAVATDKD